MTEWIAIVVMAVSYIFTGEYKQLFQVPMETRAACENFAQGMAKNAPHQVSTICISTKTGETFFRMGEKKYD